MKIKIIKVPNLFSTGGTIHTHGGDFPLSGNLTIVNNGGTHSENPNDGVLMGIAPDGMPNLVELDEVIWNDYVFSNRLKPSKKIREKYKLNDDLSYADSIKKVTKAEGGRLDFISSTTRDAKLLEFLLDLEDTRMAKQAREARKQLKNMSDEDILALQLLANLQLDAEQQLMMMEQLMLLNPEGMFAKGGHMFKKGGPEIMSTSDIWDLVNSTVDKRYDNPFLYAKKEDISEGNLPTWMRYAPIVGSGISALTSLFDRPDYSNADAILLAYNITPNYIDYKPIGNYLAYNPFDINYTANLLRASELANARALANASAGNAGALRASLLSNAYNSQLGLGNAYRLAQEANLAQRAQVGEFNRGTDMANALMYMEAQKANLAAQMEADRMRATGASTAALLRAAEDARIATSRNANLTALFDNLGALGQENYNINDRNMLIRAGLFGTLSLKPLDWSDDRWEAYRNAILGKGYGKKNGGRIRRKKGLTD